MKASRIFLAVSSGVFFSAQAKHVHVVVLAHQHRILFVLGDSRADTGDLVGGDANTNAAGADEQPNSARPSPTAIAAGLAKSG